MRVLCVTYEFGHDIKGGIGRVVNAMAQHIKDKTRLDILLIKRKFGEWKGIFFQDTRMKRVLNGNRTSIQTIDVILKKQKYDILHFFAITPQIKDLLVFVRDNYPVIKIIYSCHSILAYDQSLRKNFPDILPVEKSVLRLIDGIHLLHPTALQMACETYPEEIKRIPTYIIPNGIEERDYSYLSKSFYNKILHKKKERILIATISRWSHGKGLECLLDAIPTVIRSYPNTLFIIAGRKRKSWENGVSAYVDNIEKKASSLASHVVTLEWLDESKRNSLLSASDLCVMPSLIEYFPYSLLEPMIMRVPIVSAEYRGIHEIIDTDSECLTYGATKPNELADAILHLINHRAEGKALADKAYEHAKSQYDWHKICGRYEAMYSDLTDRPHAPKEITER
jgi:glycosyltransferase involved in cell wall biosynthesis